MRGNESFRVVWLQHVSFEGLGCIEGLLQKAGARIQCCRLFAGDLLPDPQDIDLLIVMGGPMSVNDEEMYPWLIQEKHYIRAVIDFGKPVLGICLGAQMIARVLGGRVYKNREKEIGWLPVMRVEDGPGDAFPFPEAIEVFQWHGETFDLPVGCKRIARSQACANQAFLFGRSVVGLQFHLETTPAVAAAMIAHCRHDLNGGTYVQGEEKIMAAPAAHYHLANQLMSDILGYMLQNVP